MPCGNGALSVDRRGYVHTAQGCKLARVDDDGNVWVWDKLGKREIPLRYDDLIQLWCETRIPTGGSQ